MCDSNEVRGKASRRTIYTGSSVHPMLSVVGICTVDSITAVPQDIHETGTRIIYGRSFSDQKNYSESVIRILSSFGSLICQRTIPKGKITIAPLGKMPRIDVPFRRVAMDLVGPLKPRTHSKHRHILVDYATSYPQAVRAEIHKYYEKCDWSKKWAEGLQKILT